MNALPQDIRELDKLTQEIEIQKQLVIQKSLSSNDPHEIMKAHSYFAELDKQTDKGVKSYLFDPLNFTNSLGFKDRPISLTYDVLRQMSRMYVIRSIIETRKDQGARFCNFTDDEQKEGWTIRKKRLPFMEESDMKMGREDRKRARDIAEFVLNAGTLDNKWSRDDFETFFRKTTQDSLVLDQMCLLPGQYIELWDGTPIQIENIESGMKLRTFTGLIKEVIKPTSRIYSGDIVTIKFRGQKLSVTEKHPIFAAKKISVQGNKIELAKPEFVAACDLTSNDYLVYPKYKSKNQEFEIPIFVENSKRYINNQEKFDELVQFTGICRKNVHTVLMGCNKRICNETQNKIKEKAEELNVKLEYKQCREEKTLIDKDWAYILGFYVAEGSISKGNNCINFTFSKKEIHHVIFIRDFFKKYGINSTIDYFENDVRNRQAVGITVFSKSVGYFLNKYCGKGSKNKQVPNFLFDSKEEVRIAFLKGYFEGDGCIKENRLLISTTSKKLFYGLRILLSIENIYLSESLRSYEKQGWNNQFCAQISGIFYRELAEKIQFPTYKEEHILRAIQWDDDYLYLKIENLSFEYFENVRVYNMEVEDDHSYIAEGFINHNCAEVVRDRRGKNIVEFFATDGGTYRLADTSKQYVNQAIQSPKINGYYPTYVQIYQNQISAEFYPWELIFGIRNHSTAISNNGYGISELEDLIKIITWMLNSDQYNGMFFSNGSNPKGILKVAGNVSESMLNQFKQAWYNQIVGVNNAWKIPVIQSDKMEWVDLQKNNTDMQFHLFSQYLRLIACALYKMDPIEVGFRDETQGNSLFQGSQDKKFDKSNEKGLEPYLRFWAKEFNKNIVSELDEKYEFAWTGVNPDDEQAALEADIKKVTNFEQLNELRKRRGLKPLEDGDVVLNSAYLQWKQMKSMGSPESNQAVDQETGDDSGNAYAGESDNPFENLEMSVRDQIGKYTEDLIKASYELGN